MREFKPMFDRSRLDEILRLHEKSYALLKWVKGALNTGSLSFAVVHASSDSAQAAAEWVRRHYDNIPHDARPPKEQIDTFAKLFVAFLSTSFTLKANSVRLIGCGCWCCSYLQGGPNLAVRSPSKRDFKTAHELKRIYLKRLTDELGVDDPAARIDAVLSQSALAAEIAIATWSAELLRRAEFASQGEAVLALWRQFAWKEGRPKPKFRLTANAIVDAEVRIAQAMKNAEA